MIRESFEVYHANRKHFLSSHALADFRKSPLLFHQKKTGLIKDVDNPAYLVGRALHALVLEGRDVYEREFVVGGPINEKTQKPYGKASDKFKQWASQQSKDILDDSQGALIEEMAAGVNRNEIARDLLQGQVEGVLRQEVEGIKCQIRIDCVNPDLGIVDLKSCRDIDNFESDAFKYGYGHQMAFYKNIYQIATDANVPVHLVAIEKSKPHRCGVWVVGSEWLQKCWVENIFSIRALRNCKEEDQWPSGFEEVRRLEECPSKISQQENNPSPGG